MKGKKLGAHRFLWKLKDQVRPRPRGLQNKVMTGHLSEIDPPGSLYLPACLEEKSAALHVIAAKHGAVRSADFCLQD